MADIKLPFILLRPQTDGTFHPRFVPGPRDRGLGFTGEDLRHDDGRGRWFTIDETRVWSQAKLEEIKKARISGKRIKAAAPRRGNTLDDLLQDWIKSLRKRVALGDMAQATLDGYVKSVNAIVFKPEARGEAKERRAKEDASALLNAPAPSRKREEIATAPVQAIGAPELRVFFDYAREQRGHHMALALIAAISAAMTWGRESPAWRLGINPRHGMVFDRPDGRISIVELPEFIALLEAADELGCPSVGDNCYLGLFTGQRPTDRLLIEDCGLVEGRRVLRQSKTDVIVKVKEPPQLAARLAQAKARVAAIKLAKGTRPTTIVVDERTGRAYEESSYRHMFADVRALAAKKVPSVADRTDQDFRDTFVTMTYRAMVRAGRVDLKAIADVTGHSYTSIETIIKHYLGRDAAAADMAIDTLADFIEREMAV